MLRFATPLDSVMTAILATALETRVNWIEAKFMIGPEYYDDWQEEYPRTARCLTLPQAIEQLRALRTALVAPTLYMPTDLHFLLMYETLETFIDLHNDGSDFPIACEELQFGPYPIETISFEAIADLFFWDLDFLMDEDTATRMTPAQQAMMDFSDSTRRVAMGTKAVPEDLRLEVSDDTTVLPPHQAESFFHPELSMTYPYDDEAEDDDEDNWDDEK